MATLEELLENYYSPDYGSGLGPPRRQTNPSLAPTPPPPRDRGYLSPDFATPARVGGDPNLYPEGNLPFPRPGIKPAPASQITRRKPASPGGGLDPINPSVFESTTAARSGDVLPVPEVQNTAQPAFELPAKAEDSIQDVPDFESQARDRAPGLALLMAGFGAMASQNPRWLGALGEGGAAGVAEYEKATEAARKEAITTVARKQQAEIERRDRAQEKLDVAKMDQERMLKQADQAINSRIAAVAEAKSPAEIQKLLTDVRKTISEIELIDPAKADYYRKGAQADLIRAGAAALTAQVNADASKMNTVEGRVEILKQAHTLAKSDNPIEQAAGLDLIRQINAPADKVDTAARAGLIKSTMDGEGIPFDEAAAKVDAYFGGGSKKSPNRQKYDAQGKKID